MVERDAKTAPPEGGPCTVEVDMDRAVTATFETKSSETADLGINVTGPDTPVETNETATTTLTGSNHGPDDAENFSFVTKPAGGLITGVGLDPQFDDHCTFIPSRPAEEEVRCEVDITLATGEEMNVEVEFESETPGTMILTGEISSDTEDPELSNNSDQAEITVEDSPIADLRIGLENVSTSIEPGETGTARLGLLNSGSDAPENAGFTIGFTDGAITEISNDMRVSCQPTPAEEIGCNINEEAQNFQNGMGLTVDIEYAAETEGTRDLKAEITASTEDPDTGNNTATEEVDVQESDETSVLPTDQVFEAGVGGAAEALFSITNPPSSSASGSGSVRFGAPRKGNVEETQFGDISGKLPVAMAGENGFVVRDLLTGEILQDNTQAPTGSPALGVIGLSETPRGPDSPATFVLFGETGLGFYSANFSGGTQSGNQPQAFDAFPAGGNPESSYAVFVQSTVGYIDIDEGDTRHLPRSVFDELRPDPADFDGQIISA